MRDAEIHEFCRARVKLALGRRSLAWLARQAEVPQSTLATQLAKPRFSLSTLCRIAAALDRDVAWFLPEPYSDGGAGRDGLALVLDELEDVLRKAGRRKRGPRDPLRLPAIAATESSELGRERH